MAISNATRLSDFGSGIGTQGAILQVDNTNQRVGIGTTNPTAMFSVGPGAAIIMDGNVGVVTATSFSGSGANLTGIANTGYIDSVNLTASGIVSFTNTTASTSSATGALIVSGGVGIAGSLHVGENVSVGGTLTYEDVTNIDSVGIITARSGVSIADSIFHTGDTNTAIRFPAADTFTIETSGTERVRVSSGGSFGINCGSLDNAVPARDLEVASSDGAILRLSSSDDSLAAGERLGEIEFWTDDDDRSHIGANIKAIADPSDASGRRTALTFGTQNHDSQWDATERVRIDTNGNLLVGATVTQSVGGGSALAQIQSITSSGRLTVTQHRNEAAGSPYIVLGKSRGTAVNAVTVLQNGDDIGTLAWAGADGSDMDNQAAAITAQVDGTRGSDDMPGRLIFKTTADGAGSATERMRITKTGAFSLDNGALIERCYINSTAWSTNGDLNLDNGMVQYNSANLAGTNNTLNITSSVGINTQLATGDMISVTCITAVNATTAYVNHITIDHIAVTENWVGGSAPTDGGGSGLDTYAFNIIKTGSAAYKVIANQVLRSA